MPRQFGISTAHPLASGVGRDILQSGGNAFDAAVAAAATLAVVEPMNSSVGGEGYCIYFDSGEGKCGAVCFMGEPGILATLENVQGKELLRGPLTPLAPAVVPGWFALIEKKCTLSAERLLEPAIRYAREGFLLGGEASGLNWHIEQNIFYESAHEIFVRSDRPWKPGDCIRQTDLAKTLEGIVREGPEFLHRGEMATRLDSFLESTGSLLRANDLAQCKAVWQETLSASFDDVTVHVPPPESTGFSVLLGLRLLEIAGQEYSSHDDPNYVSLVLKVLTKMEQCVAVLSGKYSPYDPRVAAEISEYLAPDSVQALGNDLRIGQGTLPRRPKNPYTTCLSAADSSGNMICLTQTLDDGFGSGVVVPGTGIILNNGLAWLETDRTKPSVQMLGPRKHYFVPIVPIVALSKQHQPYVALGTPGGNGIPQTTFQVLAHLLHGGVSVQEAIDRPRIRRGAVNPDSQSDIVLGYGFSEEVYESFGVQPTIEDAWLGDFHAVQFGTRGSINAFKDPRNDGGTAHSLL